MTKTLWYSGCSMTVGDEIADILVDPNFFISDVWDQDLSVDKNATIITDKNLNKGAGYNWKSHRRKTLRQQRLVEAFLEQCQETDISKYLELNLAFKNNLNRLEKENCWPSLMAKNINYRPVCGGENAASAGWMLYQLIENLNKNYDVYIMSWTYPTRLVYWNNVSYLRYPPGWQPAHINSPREIATTALLELFNYSFDIEVCINEYIESFVLAAKLLESNNKKWYFTIGEKDHVQSICKKYPAFDNFVKKYENHILETDLFTKMYAVTDHLNPKAMLAGHPRLEAHQIIADQLGEKIKNDL